MSLTLLIDLDDTLLDNDIDTFLPKYLQAFSEEVSSFIAPEKFIELLLSGTRSMIANQRPDCTLQEVFEDNFIPMSGWDPGIFRKVSDDFYTDVFPTLRELTRPRPEAVKLVEEVMARGYRVVIATNPLFPSFAIKQRLAWADLPTERYRFELITSYETFHFVKPKPAYYAEIMARIGWPSGPVVMIGDDLQRDILASRQMGIPCFWISNNGFESYDEVDPPSVSGSIEDVLLWIDQSPEEELLPDYSAISAVLSTLKSTPAALDSMCRDLPVEIGGQRPEDDRWSITEIFCHLCDVDREVNLPRIQMILKEKNPFISGVDTDPWAEERNYVSENSSQALQKFIQTRIDLIDLLETMRQEDWHRDFRHAIFGPTKLLELVSIIASHDRLHIRQVREVLEDFSIHL
jgi:FMN phosphatase YigB (HAD superfamily)